MGPSVFLLSGDGYVGEVLELHQGCQRPFRGIRGKVGFLSSRLSGKGSHLTLRGEYTGCTRIGAGNLGFLYSCNRDLRDPIMLSQESPVSMRVARGLSEFLSSRCRGPGPNIQFRSEPQASTAVLMWISGFLWSFNRVSWLVSCGDMKLRFPLKV